MIDPVILRIGPFSLRWYGVLIVGGALLAAYASSREAKRRGLNSETIWDMLLWVLLMGIVGARLYHVFSSPAGGQLGWTYYRQHPIEILTTWHGGLAIYGGLAGGFLGIATYVWRHKLDLVLWLDVITPSVLIAQALGRWGNFINQEAYGYQTDLPWGIYIPPERRLPGLERYDYFHPVFLYESLGCATGFLVTMWIARRFQGWLLKGDLFAMYFIWYGTLRFFTEGLRPDAWRVGGVPTAQIISLLVAVGAAMTVALRHTVLRPASKPAA